MFTASLFITSWVTFWELPESSDCQRWEEYALFWTSQSPFTLLLGFFNIQASVSPPSSTCTDPTSTSVCGSWLAQPISTQVSSSWPWWLVQRMWPIGPIRHLLRVYVKKFTWSPRRTCARRCVFLLDLNKEQIIPTSCGQPACDYRRQERREEMCSLGVIVDPWD